MVKDDKGPFDIKDGSVINAGRDVVVRRYGFSV